MKEIWKVYVKNDMIEMYTFTMHKSKKIKKKMYKIWTPPSTNITYLNVYM